MLPLPRQFVVFATKRSDDPITICAGQASDPITVQAGTIDDTIGGEIARSSLHHNLIAAQRHAKNAHVGANFATSLFHLLCVFDSHSRVIGDRRPGHVDSLYPGGMRFDFAQAFRANHRQARNVVSYPALIQGFQLRQFCFGGGYNDFAATLIRNAAGLAEVEHGCRAFHAHLGLEGPRPVIQPRMDDAAVVPALVRGNFRFLLQNGDSLAAQAFSQRHGGRQAHDAASDNHDIELLAHAGAPTPSFDLKLAAMPTSNQKTIITSASPAL